MFVPVSKNLLEFRFREDDPSDVRLANFVHPFEGGIIEPLIESLNPGDIVILGYPDDRGVDRNGGRSGAAEGPDTIRKYLYRMTPCRRMPRNLKIVDLGNFRSWSLNLEEAHNIARKNIGQIRSKGCKIVTLGGGHDWAFPDFIDFSSYKPSGTEKSHIINFDAHLDMRPNPESADKKNHSGTPFRKILEHNSGLTENRLSCVGLQEVCNSTHHIQWALGKRASLIFLEDFPSSTHELMQFLVEKLELKSPIKTTYGLSIDMDAFPQGVSPGVSAPQAIGLDPLVPIHTMTLLKNQVLQLGVYETNPRFDRDDATSRLAARMVFEFLSN